MSITPFSSPITLPVLPFGLVESDVHDVINLFQATGLDARGRYFMNPCPAEKGDYIEFFAEQDVMMALSMSLSIVALISPQPCLVASSPITKHEHIFIMHMGDFF